MPSRRSLLKALATLAALAVLAAPAVLVFWLGWIRIQSPEAFPRRDPSPIEAWAALAVFYVLWVALVLAGLVVVLDRLGYKYTPVELPGREGKQQRRRRLAAMGYLRARQDAPPRQRPRRTPAGAEPPSGGDTAERGAADRGATGDKPRPPGDGKAA